MMLFPTQKPSNGRSRPYAVVFALSLVCLAAGAVVSPARSWGGWFTATYYFLGLGTGAALFLAFNQVAGARWYLGIRRVPEALVSTLPVASLLFFAVLALGTPSLYPWAHDAAPAGHHVSTLASFWLTRPFFLARSAVYLAIWCLLGQRLVRASRAAAGSRPGGRAAALFLVGFAATYWIASMDWIMSLEPEWYSTMLWVSCFTGSFLSALAAIALLVALQRKNDARGAGITDDQLHDFGKLLLGFSVFWVYIWFSQYMLTWYANIPEETSYYRERLRDGWTPLMFANVIVNWVLPFLVLLRLAAKRSADVLLRVSLLLLVGRAFDLFLMIQPRFQPSGPRLGLWELAPAAGVTALALLLLGRQLGAAAPEPPRARVLQRAPAPSGARSSWV